MAFKLRGQTRESSVKGVNSKLRAEGKIPGILYGKNIDSQPVAIDFKDFNSLMNAGLGANSVITFELGDKNHSVMVRELQRDQIKGDILHIDLQRVSMTDEMVATVPIWLVGEEEANKNGIVQTQIKEIEVKGLPNDLPDHVQVDVSSLELGDALYVKDVNLPEKLELLTEEEELVVSIVSAQEESEEAEEQEITEPEVIGKGKEEEE
ncbi:50S ribosomal protein L25 [Proteinivorax hydrogeniformans]|uniref:Large ribosomal subunit protein bL25 n=1 Tax=Proteinivorax hydrogeniformans TaxID=1826727 RepID=A0AAU8HTB8_9FIRM